ncbi:3969_t:CDS:2, partial [Dentiscutata erythropus]
VWVEKDQEIMMYPDPDETTARNAVIALRQARAQNNTLAMSVVSLGFSARISDALELTSKNVCHQEILGAIVLSATNKLYIWGAKNINGTSQKTDNSLNTICAFLEHTKAQNLNVVAIVTDSASSYASARRKIQLERPDLVFLPCFVHQANLCIGDIFRCSSEYKCTADITFWKNVDELADCLLLFYEDETGGFAVIFNLQFQVHALSSQFNNTLEAISEEHNIQGKMANNIVRLALLRYWEFAALNLKEISMVAQRLFSIKVNSAPCERLFFRMGWFYTSQRCRFK